jgi:calmodulin
MSDEFTEAEVEQARRAFTKIDLNGDGQIDEKEVAAALTAVALTVPPSSEIQRMIKEVDLDSSGTVSFDEFLLVSDT